MSLLGLAQLQQLLQSMHGIQAGPVGEFLVGGDLIFGAFAVA